MTCRRHEIPGEEPYWCQECFPEEWAKKELDIFRYPLPPEERPQLALDEMFAVAPVLSYRPNDDEAAVAYEVAKRRNSMNAGQSNIPGGEHATVGQRLAQHYAACLSEISLSRITNLCWTGCGKGAHGLLDVGDRYEVRSIVDRTHGLLVREKDCEKDVPFALFHVSEETRICELLGWAPPSYVVSKGFGIDLDSEHPAWILPIVQLFSWPPE